MASDDNNIVNIQQPSERAKKIAASWTPERKERQRNVALQRWAGVDRGETSPASMRKFQRERTVVREAINKHYEKWNRYDLLATIADEECRANVEDNFADLLRYGDACLKEDPKWTGFNKPKTRGD